MITIFGIIQNTRADLMVVQEITSTNPDVPGGAHEMTIMVSGGKLRIEHAQGGMILLPAEKKSIMLMHQQRAYMIMTDSSQMPGMGGAQAQTGADQRQASDPPEDINWEKTGQKQQIAGYDAEQWIGKDKVTGKMNAEVWIGGSSAIAKEYYTSLGSLGRGGMIANLGEKFRAVKETGPYAQGYPLKTTTYDENGTATATTTVKKLDTSPVDAKWFAIPDGYQEMKMPSMGQGGMPSMPDSGE